MALKQATPTKVTVGNTDFYIRPFSAFKAANITGGWQVCWLPF